MPNRKGNITNSTHGLSKTRIYRIWGCMIQRITNPKNTKYHLYGGKGIKVCEEWKIFDNFYRDMNDLYESHVKAYGEKDTSIDRFNGDGDYCPANCRWATSKEQRMNGSRISMHEVNGLELCMNDWSRIMEIPLTTVWDRIKSGKSMQYIFDNQFGTRKIELPSCEHNGYTIRNVCRDCGKYLNKEESDRCCTGG